MVGMPVCEHSVNHTQRFGFASLQPCSPSSRPTGQVKPPDPKPQVTSLRSSPGANRVAPLRGAYLRVTMWHLSEVLSGIGVLKSFSVHFVTFLLK